MGLLNNVCRDVRTLFYQISPMKCRLQVWLDLGANGGVGVPHPGDIAFHVQWGG